MMTQAGARSCKDATKLSRQPSGVGHAFVLIRTICMTISFPMIISSADERPERARCIRSTGTPD